MNPFQKLLQSIGASGIKRASGVIDDLVRPASGLIDDLVRPALLVDSQRPIQKSAGVLSGDILERLRPTNKSQQKGLRYSSSSGDFQPSSFLNREVFLSPRRAFSPSVFNETGVYSNLDPTQRFLQQYAPIQRSVGTSVADNYVPIQKSLGTSVANTAASLNPTSAPTAFPFDDPLTLLKGQARYAQRQIQGGIGQVGNLYKKLQGVGPTAINPLATKTPTTFLGKAGQLINPLNPINLAGYATAGLINQFAPENGPLKGNLELLAGIPGGPLAKLFGTGMLAATPLGMSDKQETALSQIGKNYIVNGIQYDYKTGRAINPPPNTFAPDRSAAPPDNSGFIEIDNNTNNRRPESFSSPRNTEAERRSYLSELSSVAQQTAQNPLLNQYNALRKPDPRAAEDLGMQMFALANPELAKKVRPGQAGYDVMQRVYPQATTTATLPTSVGPTELTEEEIAIAKQMFYNQY